MPYRKRKLEEKLKEYIDFFSVVAVTGPRQSGKSTLIKKLLKGYKYVTFDNKTNVNLFYHDPERFMRLYGDKVIFDEAQKAPEIFDYIKLLVDEDRQKTGKFILSSSSQLSFSKEVAESLAGRMGLLNLLPYEYGEMPKALQDTSLYFGSYPELVDKRYRLFDDWYASYIETSETFHPKMIKPIETIREPSDQARLIYRGKDLSYPPTEIMNYTSYLKSVL